MSKAVTTQSLIDRAVLFGNPEIAGAELSPDGRYLTFLKENHGILNIWLKKIDEPFAAARPLTAKKRPLAGYFWTEDSRYILYLQDHDGDENYNLYALDPEEGDEKTLPPAKNLTPYPDARVFLYHLSQNNPDLLWLGLNQRDPAWHDLFKLSISTGKLEKIYENTDRITEFEFDWDDQLRILERTNIAGDTELFALAADGALTPIFSVPLGEMVTVAGWSPDNKAPYVITNQGDNNLAALFSLDLESLELTKIESDPKGRVDINGVSFDRNTRQLVATSYTDDETVYYWRDKERQKNYAYLLSQFPDRRVSFSSATNDYSKYLIVVWGDHYASETYLFEPKASSAVNRLVWQYVSRPRLKEAEERLSPMRAIRYLSRDGYEIPAYFTAPLGREEKNLPLVVLVHGGPKGPRDYWGYDSEVQFLANRGYAVLQPNYRASGGYGKKFLNAGDKEWGRLMQDDITYGVNYLVEKGMVNPQKVVIMGGSYGGYATLAGLAFTPEVYCGGVDIVGPSNLFTLLASIPPYWEAGRAELYAMVGDPETEEGKKLLKNASPLFSVDQINAPLLIVQGANDPRVKRREADQIVAALRDKQKKVVYLLAGDEGHGFAKPRNRMAMYAEVEKFLADVLGGVYQEDMPADVKETLEKLRVDIKTVKNE